MHQILLHTLIAWRPAAYAIVFFGMIVEGEAVLLLASFLSRQQILDIGTVIAVGIAGMLTGDALLFWLGRKFFVFPALVRRAAARISESVDQHLAARPFSVIFFSKFVIGINKLLIIRAGTSGVSTMTFFKSDAAATILWALLIAALGYGSGAPLIMVRRSVFFAQILLLALFIAFLAGWRVLSSRLKKFL